MIVRQQFLLPDGVQALTLHHCLELRFCRLQLPHSLRVELVAVKTPGFHDSPAMTPFGSAVTLNHAAFLVEGAGATTFHAPLFDCYNSHHTKASRILRFSARRWSITPIVSTPSIFSTKSSVVSKRASRNSLLVWKFSLGT